MGVQWPRLHLAVRLTVDGAHRGAALGDDLRRWYCAAADELGGPMWAAVNTEPQPDLDLRDPVVAGQAHDDTSGIRGSLAVDEEMYSSFTSANWHRFLDLLQRLPVRGDFQLADRIATSRDDVVMEAWLGYLDLIRRLPIEEQRALAARSGGTGTVTGGVFIPDLSPVAAVLLSGEVGPPPPGWYDDSQPLVLMPRVRTALTVSHEFRVGDRRWADLLVWIRPSSYVLDDAKGLGLHRVIDFLRQQAQVNDVVFGGAWVGEEAVTGTPLESALSLAPAKTVPAARHRLRGYQWITIVPGELAKALGGVAAMRTTGAFVEVDQLPCGGVWLRATDDPQQYDPVAAERVFHAVAPVLPAGLPSGRERSPLVIPIDASALASWLPPDP